MKTPYRSRNAPRRTLEALAAQLGVNIGTCRVCPGHSAPSDFLIAWVFERPGLSLVHGPRGGGKSFLRAFATHVDSIWRDAHSTRILGGSLAQSKQVYGALKAFRLIEPSFFTSFTEERAEYLTGSDVETLTASSRSVRGPHVPTLCLDEIDEIDPDIREAAVGMCSAKGGARASIAMTSTWHRVGGPMTALLAKAEAGEFPYWRFCIFEVLERCPETRSGPRLEKCPECPLVKWCHDTPDGVPKAKRSNGHYAIDALIQKVKAVSRRVFEADYLCLGPKADGVWFREFDASHGANVSVEAVFDPRRPLHLAVDAGTGPCFAAVWFQVQGREPDINVYVLADFYSETLTAEAVGQELKREAERRFNGRIDRPSIDSAARARNGIGPVVLDLIQQAGLGRMDCWPQYPGVKREGLSLLESLICSATGRRALKIHPSCAATIQAFQGYQRKKRGGQWLDEPEDPQHPYEDPIDALRGGLMTALPRGRQAEPELPRKRAAQVF